MIGICSRESKLRSPGIQTTTVSSAASSEASEVGFTASVELIEPDDTRVGPQGRDSPDRAVHTREGHVTQQVPDLRARAGVAAQIR